ncbi:translocation/assembly module TamB domain-containing protein [Coraliomargarita akajimensis]|uniref:Translocation and assembly module TamB C-terminal domain-containing protein n=1 Tax=Coraliomargarita akajimensis (strain DSM 45221 / IAM 15411 / JCM 23193 / KCTC 12865 / 04OKA010-24) TaxID=583355 RepID=D5EQP8_CORAD|nr:translocation/assembly module TamB domain-containing protein [Coraliomargarita akajimensis]ADE55862.1 protein of unknown function DUF490 [Coraliomargarita akajimensis DSM 45221]
MTESKPKAAARFRRIGTVLLAGLFIALLAALSLPYWIGPVLVSVLPKWDIQLADYQATSYSRFEARGLLVDLPEARIEVDHLEASSIYAWLWRLRDADCATPFLDVGTVEVTIPLASNPANRATELDSLPELLILLDPILDELFQWVPCARCERVLVHVGEHTLSIDAIRLQELSLAGRVRWDQLPAEGVALEIRFPQPDALGPWLVAAPELDASGELSVDSDATLAQLTAWAAYRGNEALVAAEFADGTWLPRAADWELSDWDLVLHEFNPDSPYQRVEFSVYGDWLDGTYRNRVDGRLTGGVRLDYAQELPELTFSSGSEGSGDQITLQRLKIDGPGIYAALKEPVRCRVFQPELLDPLSFVLEWDLDALGISALTGHLTAALELEPTLKGVDGMIHVEGQSLSVADYQIEDIDIGLLLENSVIRAQQAQATIVGLGRVEASGLFDLKLRRLDQFSLKTVLEGDAISRWLPEAVELQRLAVELEAEGSLDALEHRGYIQVEGVKLPASANLLLGAEWSGIGLRANPFRLSVVQGDQQCQIGGSVQLEDRQLIAEVGELTLSDAGQVFAALIHPLTLQIGTDGTVHLEGLEMAGSGGRLALSGAYRSQSDCRWSLAVEGVETAQWLAPWLSVPVPEVEVALLDCEGSWDHGPLSLDAKFRIGHGLAEDLNLFGSGELQLEGTRARFKSIEVADHKGPWLRMHGELPLAVYPAEAPHLRVDEAGSMDFEMVTAESGHWIHYLPKLSVFELERFDSSVRLSGSAERPEGHFQLKARTREFEAGRKVPPATVEMEGAVDGKVVRVPLLKIGLEDQHFAGSASVRLPRLLRECLLNRVPLEEWQATQFSLRIPKSSLSPLRYFFPKLLSEGGTIATELNGSAATGITGHLELEDLSTRHIFPFGSIRDVDAVLNFDQGRASLSSFSGYIGQQPLMAQGYFDYREWPDTSCAFELNGEDVALLRKPGLMLRADLDLDLLKERQGQARLSGIVDLKDGVYLQDVTALMQRSAPGQSAVRRPPYFAVEASPWNEVVLDLQVNGKDFMRLDTPVVNGILTANVSLSGTLGEPVSVGTVRFEEGNLLFPFAGFELEQGRIDLLVNDPYTPVLDFSGFARRYGYDLEVEITGTAYDPQVQFFSSPHLSSHAIMQMVIAGVSPDGGFRFSATEAAQRFGSYLSKNVFVSRGKASKNPTERFSMNTGENLSEQGKETVDLELRLTDRIYATGEYDEYDFWNAGLRFRVVRPRARNGGATDADVGSDEVVEPEEVEP